MLFSQTVDAVLRGQAVTIGTLLDLDFKTAGHSRIWTGDGPLKTNDNKKWDGIGNIAQISGLERAAGGLATQASFTITGDKRLVKLLLEDKEEYFNRPITVFMQVFDQDMKCLDNPAAIWSGYMDAPSIGNSQGGTIRTLTISAESLFMNRATPPYGTYSDRDQQARYPGDTGCTYLSTLIFKNMTSVWP